MTRRIGVMNFLPFLRLTDGIFYEFSKFDVKYLDE